MIRGATVRAATIAAMLLAACSSTRTSDPCDPAAIPAGLGCEFWPTVTANAVDGDLPFGVALVNPGTADASIQLAGGALGPGIFASVPGQSSVYWTLPWVEALKACSARGDACASASGTSVLASGGAYRIETTQPIAAYQFSPAPGDVAPGSADASALPGAHALGTRYVAAAWAASAGGAGVFPGFVAVTAVADGTTVEITPTVAIEAGDLPAFAAGVPTSVRLDRGDVLELLAYAGDLSGTRVEADRPVQLVGGHFCARVPAGVGSCDHLEEVLPPLAALGASYVILPPMLVDGIVVRVVATADGTALSYSAPIPGAPATLEAGQFADFVLADLVQIASNHPVLVAQYLRAGELDGYGDPSLAVATPVARWRTSYAVDVSARGGNVDVIAPAGATVRFDGEPLWFPPAGSGYVVSGVGYGGSCRLESDMPFTVSAYGLGPGWSFWYAPALAP